MTSYTGIGRTNTFRVNDTAEVKALLEPAFTVLERDAGAPGSVTIFSDDDGDWQRTLFADDDDEDGTEIYLPDWIIDHLQPGETAIFVHIGNEGQRHLGAFSIAVHSDGRQIHLNLEEIYQRAETEFGVTGLNIASH